MTRITPRQTWFMLAIGAIALAAATVLLSDWFHLDPCYLCVFQRVLLFVMGGLALGAAIFGTQRLAGCLFGLAAPFVAFFAIGIASYQSWLQMQPPGSITCVGGNPGSIELVVEWLGQRMPSLFLATGFCEDDGMILFGLSLANWAVLCFTIFFITAIWTLRRSWANQAM